MSMKAVQLNFDYAHASSSPKTDFFKTHPVLVNSRIPCVICFNASLCCEFGEKGFHAAFESEITRTLVNYSYSRTLLVMALAVYPDQNHKVLPV